MNLFELINFVILFNEIFFFIYLVESYLFISSIRTCNSLLETNDTI